VTERVLVAGVGNLFFGDDGFGPEVARRLAGADLPPPVTVVDYGIRGMHLAYDLLDGYDVLVLVDAVARGGAAGDLYVLDVGPDDLVGGQLDAHGMNPAAMLSSLEVLGGRLPTTFLVGCEPDTVAEGIGLSATVAGRLDDAVAMVRQLLDRVGALPGAGHLARTEG
jgi:hydrogenase maturation protease